MEGDGCPPPARGRTVPSSRRSPLDRRRDPALADCNQPIWERRSGMPPPQSRPRPPESTWRPARPVGAPARLSTDPTRRSGRQRIASVSAGQDSRRFVTDRLGDPLHRRRLVQVTAGRHFGQQQMMLDQRAHRFTSSSENPAVVITLASGPGGHVCPAGLAMSWRRAPMASSRALGAVLSGQPRASLGHRLQQVPVDGVAVIGLCWGDANGHHSGRIPPRRPADPGLQSPRPARRCRGGRPAAGGLGRQGSASPAAHAPALEGSPLDRRPLGGCRHRDAQGQDGSRARGF